MQFDSFDFHPAISANIKAQGYETPTPIQSEAIPHVLEGRDVMGLAQTGTGKTAAFLLPIIDRFLKNPKPMRGSCRALVIAPTRELAEQIHESARAYTKGMRFRTVTVYGGVGLGPQASNLRRGADLVVACPGRLLDHLNQGNANLSYVETLVLDEADHMFDMGFLPDIKKILSRLPAERQTLLFSATMPESIRGLANETLKDPALVRIGRTAPACTIEQCLYPVPHHLKTKLLLNLLGDNSDGSVLVFTRTKHRAKRLAEQLERCGHPSACLQGNLSQSQRQRAMEGFRAGRFRILVATDIAARGIDVSRVAHVVNYDLPDTPETYTHRVGRTGRAEREGQAHSLVTSEDVSMVRAIERLLGKPIERRKLEGFDYAASAPERDREFERPPLPGRRPGQDSRGRSGYGGYGGQGGQPRGDSRQRPGRYASDGQGGDAANSGNSGSYQRADGQRAGWQGQPASRDQGDSNRGQGYRGRGQNADSGNSWNSAAPRPYEGERRSQGGQPRRDDSSRGPRTGGIYGQVTESAAGNRKSASAKSYDNNRSEGNGRRERSGNGRGEAA